MITDVQKVLVIGGGFSGMSAAIELSRLGLNVDLLEQDAAWAPLGAGITLSAPSVRALEHLGVADKVAAQGFCADGLDLFSHDETPIMRVDTPLPVGSQKVGAGILRPVLSEILAQATRAQGVKVRLGETYTDVSQDAEHVAVTFSAGDTQSYDLVVGAEGVHSRLRQQLFPDADTPAYTGQACWRAVLPRPEHIVRPTIWMGPTGKVGVNPISQTQMYMFYNEPRPIHEHLDPATWPALMADLLRPFAAPTLQALLPCFTPDMAVDFRPLHNLLLPLSWHKGRIVLIGDAVHATTPHLASGAGIGIESGIVLAEEMRRHTDLASALVAFEQRHYPRCALVVNNSKRLLDIENGIGDKAEHGPLMGQSMARLAQPI